MPIYQNALSQQPANRLAYQDRIGATPRNEYLGALADWLAQSYAPQRTQQMQGVAQFLGVPAVSQTLDRLSYGEPLTTGRGMTTQVRPEVLEAAMTVAPMAKPVTMATLEAARQARRAALAGGRAVGEEMVARMLSGQSTIPGLPASVAPSPVKFAVNPNTQSIVREGNPIQSAVVLIGDKIFTGRTHADAFNRAIYEGVVRKENGKFIYPKDAEVNSDLFMTKGGQIIDRLQASKMFDIGASETAIEKGLMQNKPASSMSVDSYMEQAKAMKQSKEKPSFVYPQDEALRLAQQRAALPPSQGGLGLPANNTAQQRLDIMFPDDVYHGSKTPENIKKLVAGGEPGSIRTGDAYGTGVYTTTDAAGDASAYGAGGAVFPLRINRSGHLQIDAPNADDLQKLSKFAGESMLPSDKARFAVGRERREFADVQDARDFFANQRENWNQFGGGYDRARPEALANPDGTFAVEFTNFDAPVPITSGKDADTLLRATGYDNVQSLGYTGHTLDRGAGRLWDVTTDTDQLRSRFAAGDPWRRTAATAAAFGVAAPDLLAAESQDDINQMRKLKANKK